MKLLRGFSAAFVALLAVGSLFSTALRAQSSQPGGYHLLHTYTLPGDQRWWDYLAIDAATHRLFIARQDTVQVVDVRSGKVVGAITDTQGVHGVALAPGLLRGFISAGGANAVVIFDLKTLARLATVPVSGTNPDAIVYDPASRRVFTMNGRSNNATAIDAATGKVLGDIDFSQRPEFAAADGAGHIFVNLESSSEMLEFDARSLKVMRRWALTGCESPSGLAYDQEHARLFSGCHNRVLAVSDARRGAVLTTLPIGPGVDANRFDPATGLFFSSNGGEGGSLTVIHEDTPDKFSELGSLTTMPGARTMALDPTTHQVYLVTAKFAPAVAGHRPQSLPGTFTLLVVGR